jgi:nucleoside-diphosphate-sugar epimerase
MSSNRYTVLGGNGFIGSALCRALQGKTVFAPARAPIAEYLQRLQGQALGKVFYCIGMTADFRNQPFATIDANLLLLRHILEECEFERLVYLSSTRVYAGAAETDEDATLRMRPHDPDHLYNLSKAMGESLCLHSGRDVCVARLSNVYGTGMQAHNFLASLLQEAKHTGKLYIRTAPDSVKDYIAVHDVVRYLLALAEGSRYRLYNLASGVNTSHQQIATVLRTLGVKVEFLSSANSVVYPKISTQRLIAEFGKSSCDVLGELAGLFQSTTSTP